MHPIEHLYYFACILPSLVFYASPFHFLWNGVHLLLSPGASHSGFDDHFQVTSGSEEAHSSMWCLCVYVSVCTSVCVCACVCLTRSFSPHAYRRTRSTTCTTGTSSATTRDSARALLTLPLGPLPTASRRTRERYPLTSFLACQWHGVDALSRVCQNDWTDGNRTRAKPVPMPRRHFVHCPRWSSSCTWRSRLRASSRGR